MIARRPVEPFRAQKAEDGLQLASLPAPWEQATEQSPLPRPSRGGGREIAKHWLQELDTAGFPVLAGTGKLTPAGPHAALAAWDRGRPPDC